MFNFITYNTPLVPAIMSETTLTRAGAYGPTAFVIDHLTTFDIVVKNGDAGKYPLYVPFRCSRPTRKGGKEEENIDAD